MDDAGFDALTRSFSDGTTRRGLTRLLAGLTLGGLLYPLASDAKKRRHGKGKGKGNGKKDLQRKKATRSGKHRPQSAACRPPGERCSRIAPCCSGRCSSKSKGTCPPCTADGECTGGRVCLNGACSCNGQTCGSACGCATDQICQNGQCGPATPSCVPACTGGQVCQSGQCTCPDGAMLCDGSCVDPQIDPDHCGTCGTACDGGSGTCRGGACATPEVCDRIDNDFDGAIDEDALCPGTKVCQGGECLCPAGTQDCNADDICEPLGTNERCANCNHRCDGGTVCRGGECRCPAATLLCGDRCEPLGTDQHCAHCNDACGAGQVCQGGQCVCQAEDRQTTCGEGGCGPKTNNCGQSLDCGGCHGDLVECLGGQCFPPAWMCFGDGYCPGDQVCDLTLSDMFGFGTCICGASQDCSDGCTCAVGRACQGGECVCMATTCGSDCCLDGWTCQEGHCVCLTGPQCGYGCCPAGLGCLNGPFGPGCVAPGEGCSGPVCNDYMA